MRLKAVTEAEVDPLGRLGEVSVARAECLNAFDGALRAEVEFDAGANGIAVRTGAFELERDGRVRRGRVVANEPDARPCAVGEPEIEVAVPIPIAEGETAPVVVEIEPGGGGDVGEALVVGTEVEEAAFAFVSAESPALPDHEVQRSPGFIVLEDRGRGG